jgi:hypothetical protein
LSLAQSDFTPPSPQAFSNGSIDRVANRHPKMLQACR